MRRSSSKRSRMPGLTTSLRCTTPRARARRRRLLGHDERRAAAAGDVVRGLLHGGGQLASGLRQPAADRIAGALAGARAARSSPLMRVSALNGTNSACGSAGAIAWPPSVRSCSARTTIERPSGVSSARLDRRAAPASSSGSTPGAGSSSEAWRLPSVIVPVLSSRSVLTSPAASTARPLIASTLRCTRRSMPAMPIAESSAPIVVGIRQTSRAMRMISGCSCPSSRRAVERCDRDQEHDRERGEQHGERDLVRRALAGGALDERDHPVDERVARLEVMRTTIRSDSTFVPPVTALRSPPDSRITGADSPVTADSSTLATPSITSPSLGITSPASQTTWSPSCRSAAAPAPRAGGGIEPAALGAAADGAQRVGLRLAAALGDGLREVREEHGEPEPDGEEDRERAGIGDREGGGEHEPASTTNITGACTIVRGSSLRTAPGSAARSSAGSRIELRPASPRGRGSGEPLRSGAASGRRSSSELPQRAARVRARVGR